MARIFDRVSAPSTFFTIHGLGFIQDPTDHTGQIPDRSWLLVLLMSIGAVIGFVAVLLLKKMRIATFGVPLVELLEGS